MGKRERHSSLAPQSQTRTTQRCMASSGTSSTSRTTKSTTSATTWERRGEVRPSTWRKRELCAVRVTRARRATTASAPTPAATCCLPLRAHATALAWRWRRAASELPFWCTRQLSAAPTGTKSWEDSLGEVPAQVVKHSQGTRLIELLVRAVFALELLSLEVLHHHKKRTQLGVCRGARPYTNVT